MRHPPPSQARQQLHIYTIGTTLLEVQKDTMLSLGILGGVIPEVTQKTSKPVLERLIFLHGGKIPFHCCVVHNVETL